MYYLTRSANSHGHASYSTFPVHHVRRKEGGRERERENSASKLYLSRLLFYSPSTSCKKKGRKKKRGWRAREREREFGDT